VYLEGLVQLLIREATAPENLCKLFSGWTLCVLGDELWEVFSTVKMTFLTQQFIYFNLYLSFWPL
jgi:hypothetical protein